jgi:hypothetical protein
MARCLESIPMRLRFDSNYSDTNLLAFSLRVCHPRFLREWFVFEESPKRHRLIDSPVTIMPAIPIYRMSVCSMRRFPL